MEKNWHFQRGEFPMELRFSLAKLGDFYREQLDAASGYHKERAKHIIDLLETHPRLSDGLCNHEEIVEYQNEIDIALSDLFPTVLQSNEIKIAGLPYHEDVIKSSHRYRKIISQAGDGFVPTIKNFNEDHVYIMGCSIILKHFYNYKVDFRRPFFYEIPDGSGMMRHYRMVYNGDYINIDKKENTPAITQEDVDVLLDNFDNIELWKEKFPSEGYIFRGFLIANFYDATTDVSISSFKSGLLRYDQEETDFPYDFETIFRSIFDLPELQIGFSNYNEENMTFEIVPFKQISSYLLYGETEVSCTSLLCRGSYSAVFNTGDYFALSDVEKYYNAEPTTEMYKNLFDQGIRSVILAPIRNKGNLLGIMELASPQKGALNSINANKLADIMPFLVDSVLRNKEHLENEIDLVIQNECTSIHKSVYWKFEQEAKRFLRLQLEGDTTVQYRDVVFEDVYPLFGQIDIKGSSDTRNKATQQDILLQLSKVKEILQEALHNEPLPIYEKLIHNLNTYHAEVEKVLEIDSERKILNFLQSNIQPLFTHLLYKTPTLQNLIVSYRDQLEDNLGLIYKYRKIYDDTVMLLNKRMASVLKNKQKEAQKMYPHFFELFKTDGIEHNMYIGESITKEKIFNKIYLYNLRLWQLQIMCEMENVHYTLSQKLEKPLEVASMILVFNTSLSVRYRMDEKHFDVDGTYNARYEIVKKRVDKALIKGTNERITQPGKITIVYSQKEDEVEYLKYINFLQSKNQLGEDVEILELEDLQAVTGLKALRVNILYENKVASNEKEYYNYEDLMSELQLGS